MQQIHPILGYAGLIPFVGLAFLTWQGWPQAYFYLLTYAALILSFLGGVVWLATIQSNQHWLIAVASNVVMLLAWLAVIFHESGWALSLIAGTMLAHFLVEKRYLRLIYDDSFFQLRKHLTYIAVLSIVTADVLR